MPEIRLSRSCERIIEGTDFTQSFTVRQIKFCAFGLTEPILGTSLSEGQETLCPKGFASEPNKKRNHHVHRIRKKYLQRNGGCP